MKIPVLLLLLGVLWKPFVGFLIYIYIAVYALMIIWILLDQKAGGVKVKNENNKYTLDEFQVIEKYYIFLRYPFVSRSLSAMFSGFQIAVFVLTPYFAYKALWIPAILVAISYFVSPQFSVKLNPQFFLHDNLDKGKIKDGHEFYQQYSTEMKAIDSTLAKMYLKKEIIEND